MSEFTTRLQHQLREAAEREERRSSLGSVLSRVRYRMPGPGAFAAAAVAALLVAAVIVAGGLDWGSDERTTGPRVIGDVQLADNLGYVEPGFGSVWISDTHGTILRVDPRTRAVRQRIRIGGNDNAPGGTPSIAAGAGAVWAIAQPPDASRRAVELLRIDPQTGNVGARHVLRKPDGKPFLGTGIQILGGAPWVIGANGSMQIDPATGAASRFVKTELPAGQPYPLSTIGDDHNLWILTREERILRYDLATGRLVQTLPARLPDAAGVIPSADGPLLGDRDGTLARADARDGHIAWSRRIGNALSVPLVLGDVVYAHASDINGGRDRLVVLDARTGEVRSSTGLPQFGDSGMAPVGDELWLVTPTGHLTILSR
jgi:hypothetical protein